MKKSLLKRRWSSASLALLVFALVCDGNSTTILTATAIAQTNPVVPLGAGLNGEVDYSQDIAFADAMKTAGIPKTLDCITLPSHQHLAKPAQLILHSR